MTTINYYEDFAFGILNASGQIQQKNEWMTAITVASARMWGRKNTPIFGDNVDEILAEFLRLEYKQKYLIIQSSGHFIHSKSFFSAIEKDLSQSLFVGHILLAGSEDTPYLHKQCIALNVDAWKHMGRPRFDSGAQAVVYLDFPNFVCTNGYWHDNYTPKLIQKMHGEGNERKRLFRSGAMWFKHQLDAHDKAYSFNEPARNSKFNIYSQDTGAFLDSKERLRKLQERFKDTVYFHETDKISREYNESVTTLVTVASGLRVPRYLSCMPNVSKIIVYDLSWAALTFQRELRDNKDHYMNLIELFKRKYPHVIEIPPALKDQDYANLYTKFIEEIPHSAIVKDKWRMIETDFVLADLISQPERIVDLIEPGENVLFDVSNVYTMPLNFVERTYEDMSNAYYSLLRMLVERASKIKIVGFDTQWNPINYDIYEDI